MLKRTTTPKSTNENKLSKFRSIDYIDTQERLDAYIDELTADLRARIAELEADVVVDKMDRDSLRARIAELEAIQLKAICAEQHNATIERCAQVAENNHCCGKEIAYAIRAQKDKP